MSGLLYAVHWLVYYACHWLVFYWHIQDHTGFYTLYSLHVAFHDRLGGWIMAGKLSSHCCWINHMHSKFTIITCCLCDVTTWLCSFLIRTVSSLLCSTAQLIAVDRSSVHMCWQMASNNQYTLPLSLPRKKMQAVSPSYTQCKGQKDHLQRIS